MAIASSTTETSKMTISWPVSLILVSHSSSDNDGSNDMILVSKSLRIDLFMNKFPSDSSDLCKANDNLSSPYSGFDSHDVDNHHFFYQLKDVTGSIYLNDDLPGTGVVRMGDLELDGYQDIALTITGTDNSPKTYFFANKGCPDDVIKSMTTGSEKIDFSKCRYFQKTTAMKRIEDVITYSTSFFDFHELG